MNLTTTILGMIPFALAQPASAEPVTARYSLLNPTPRELWRPMNTDRPGFTDTPYSVDAGAMQLEMSLVDWSRNGDGETLAMAASSLKLGLLHDVDLQWVFTPFVHDDPHRGPTSDGLGDMQVRLKLNLWGNDGGPSALAVIPFVALPTASDDLGSGHVAGGIVVPIAFELPEPFALAVMLKPEFVYDDGPDDDYDTLFTHSAVLSVAFTDQLGAYIEGAGIASSDGDSDYQTFISTAVTFTASSNLILDAGAIFGLSGDAADVNLFTGLSIRF